MRTIFICILNFLLLVGLGWAADAPKGFSVTQSGNITQLKWSTSNVDFYRVYQATGSSGKFNSFPSGWTLIATVMPTPTYTSYSYEDTSGNTYTYYVTTAVKSSVESSPSTMGSKVKLYFPYTPGVTNAHRISLPYYSGYQKASDIVTYLEGSLTTTPTKIDTLALWDVSTQSYIPYGYDAAAHSWVGTDWYLYDNNLVAPTLYIQVLSSFTWTVVGTDLTLPLSFTYSSTSSNHNKKMLPYSSVYSKASDIVIDIEGSLSAPTKIIRVAKWDMFTRTYQPYGYQQGLGIWAGTDFPLSPGDIINITPKAGASTFTWTPSIVFPNVP